MAPLRNLSASLPALGLIGANQMMTGDEFQANAIEDFVSEVFRLTLACENIEVAKFLIAAEPAEYSGSGRHRGIGTDGPEAFTVFPIAALAQQRGSGSGLDAPPANLNAPATRSRSQHRQMVVAAFSRRASSSRRCFHSFEKGLKYWNLLGTLPVDVSL
jgi:hypothetical protein